MNTSSSMNIVFVGFAIPHENYVLLLIQKQDPLYPLIHKKYKSH